MHAKPLTGSTDGVGEVFRTNALAQGTASPLRFLRAVIFLKINAMETRNFYGKTTQTARVS